jgi:mRNA interferase RelE/StbE
MYRVRLKDKPRRQLDKIFGSRDADRIVAAILSLYENPRPVGIKKLTSNIFRIRIGDWRIIYSISDTDRLITIGKIVRRSEDTYDRVKDLF